MSECISTKTRNHLLLVIDHPLRCGGSWEHQEVDLLMPELGMILASSPGSPLFFLGRGGKKEREPGNHC